MTIQEHVFAIVIALLMSSLTYYSQKDVLNSTRAVVLNKFTVSLSSILICILYYYVAKRYIGSFPIEPEFSYKYRALSVFDTIEYEGETVLLPFYALSHLRKVVEGLMHDIYLKFLYVVFLLAPLLFLPIMNRFAIFNLILPSPFLLSNYRAYYMIGAHYSLYLIPSIFISLIHTFRAKTESQEISLGRYVLVSSSLMILVLSPISPLSGRLNEEEKILWYPGPPKVTDRTRRIHELIDQIPGNASVLTQNHVFPHLSGRTNAYLLPIDDFTPESTKTLEAYVDSLIDRCEYILLDLRALDHWTFYANRRLTSDPSFGIECLSDMVVMFRRGADTGQAPLGLEYATHYACKDMVLGSGSIVADPIDGDKMVALSPTGYARGFFLYGPYTHLTGGYYDLSLYIMVSNGVEGYLGTFEVTSSQGAELITKRDLYGYEFPDNGWKRIDVSLHLPRAKDLVEFRLYTIGAADILVDRIEVDRLDGASGPAASTRTFNFKELFLLNGTVTADGLLHHKPQDGGAVFWYRPYHRLPPGTYDVSYFMKVVPGGSPANETVITLDVCLWEGGHVVSERPVSPGDLEKGCLMEGWAVVNLEVVVACQDAVVELRGKAPSSECDIYLGHILVEPIG